MPENLRSQTFLKAAEAIIRAHEGMNNFYNEEALDTEFREVRHSHPSARAWPVHYGTAVRAARKLLRQSWAAWPIAEKLLRKQAMTAGFTT